MSLGHQLLNEIQEKRVAAMRRNITPSKLYMGRNDFAVWRRAVDVKDTDWDWGDMTFNFLGMEIILVRHPDYLEVA